MDEDARATGGRPGDRSQTTRVEPTVGVDPHATPIHWTLRAWMVVEILFGVLAIGSIFLRPATTATTFAWPIKPEVMAAVLGAFYLASAIIFVLPLFERRWQAVRVMILPTAGFASMMLLATFMHWDKFSIGTAPFVVWLASYVLPPPIFVALYAFHQRRAAPVGAAIEQPLGHGTRRYLLWSGLATVGLAVLAFAVPSMVVERGPWPMTPLTVRALCGWLVGIGLMQAWMAWEGDWRRIRLGTTMLIVLPIALAVQLARYPEQVAWSNPLLWLLLGSTSATAIVLLRLWLGGTRTPSP